jgi:hypothetical protein
MKEDREEGPRGHNYFCPDDLQDEFRNVQSSLIAEGWEE